MWHHCSLAAMACASSRNCSYRSSGRALRLIAAEIRQIHQTVGSLTNEKQLKKKPFMRRDKRENLTLRQIWKREGGSSFHSQKAFDNFIKEYFQLLLKKPKDAFGLEKFLDQFIAETNKKWEHLGYEIKRSGETIVTEFILLFFMFVIAPISFILFYPMKPEMAEDHLKIIKEQETTSFNRFIREYLSTGMVESIWIYPLMSKAVAFLQPEAKILGREFLEPGVHIELPDGEKPAEICRQIREEEKRLGIKDAMNIVTRGWMTPSEKLNGKYLDTIASYVFGAWYFRRRLFPVIKKPEKYELPIK